MKPTLKHTLAAIILVLSVTAPLAAGPFEDANAAYRDGDYATALRLYRPLADQGNDDAQAALGAMYELGYGVTQDFTAALTWFRKAADQGNDDAQAALGAMYELGYGVPQDYVQAHMWFNLVGARTSDDKKRDFAVKYRDAIAAKMTSVQIAEAQKLAREWKPTKQPSR
jgi:TPR repeat protein